MYATVHLIVGCVNGHSLHVGLQNSCRFREYRHEIAATQQVEDNVHVVHLDHDAIVQPLALHKMIEGVASLQPLARQYEVVTFKVSETQ